MNCMAKPGEKAVVSSKLYHEIKSLRTRKYSHIRHTELSIASNRSLRVQHLSYSIFASILSTNRVIEALKMNTLVWQLRQGLANLARTCVDLRPHAVILLTRQLIIIRFQLHTPTFVLLQERPAFAILQPPTTDSLEESQNSTGSARSLQGSAPTQARSQPLQNNPLRSLGDALREISQRMDEILEGDRCLCPEWEVVQGGVEAETGEWEAQGG